MSDTDERLNTFPPVTKSEWIAKVEADLKGASFDRLRSTAPGGLPVEPLYTAEDVAGLSAPGAPGVYPYVRGASPLGGWLIRQEYDDPRPSVCKELIRQDIERGVEALWVRLGPRTGCRVLTIDELDDLLGAVELKTTSIWVDGGSDALAVASGLLALAQRRGVPYATLTGGLGFDPLGLLAGEGAIQGGLRPRLGQLRDLGSWCSSNAPGLRAANVSSSPYDSGGASAGRSRIRSGGPNRSGDAGPRRCRFPLAPRGGRSRPRAHRAHHNYRSRIARSPGGPPVPSPALADRACG